MLVKAARDVRPTCLLVVMILLSTGVTALRSSPELTRIEEGKAGTNPATMHEIAHSAYGFTDSIGINTHINYYDRLYGNISLVKAKLSTLGIHHVRDGAQLLGNDYDQEMYGRWLQIGSLGIHFDAVLDPRSSIKAITQNRLRQVVELSHHLVESFEGPNEPDVSGLDNWMSGAKSFQAQIYHSVKHSSEMSRIAVLAPSMAFIANGTKVGNLSTICDYGNLHSYPGGELPSSVFPVQTDLAAKIYGQHPVIMTESGYHNGFGDQKDHPAVSENAAAKYIPRMFLENYNHGIVRTYLYELLDELPDPYAKDHEWHWGLVRNDGSEKPAFVSVANFIMLLSEEPSTAQPGSLEYRFVGDTTDVHHLLLQKRDGRFYLILWQEVTSYNTALHMDLNQTERKLTLVLEKPVTNATIYYPLRSIVPARKLTNISQFEVSVPDHAVIVELDSVH